MREFIIFQKIYISYVWFSKIFKENIEERKKIK